MSQEHLVPFSEVETNCQFEGVTVFPDWFHPNATEYWLERFEETFNPKTGVDIDGVW